MGKKKRISGQKKKKREMGGKVAHTLQTFPGYTPINYI